MIVCGLPDCFHALWRMAQEKAFKEPVPSSGTRWDGLLAAMVEHIARLHDLEAPRGATNRSASWKTRSS